MVQSLLTFVQISDTHINVDPNFTYRVPEPAHVRASTLIDHVNQLPFKIDFILHTGDIMHDPETAQDYLQAKTAFARSKYPIYYLSGNHDHALYMQEGLLDIVPDKPQGKYYYEFEVNGVLIVCLDSSIPHQPHGEIDLNQLLWLDAICSSDDARPLIVVTHHHVLPMGTPWYDRIGTINGEAVHEVLLKAKHRLRAVLFGHVHQNMTMIRDSITYVSVLSSWYQIRTWTGQEELVIDEEHLPGYNLVTLTNKDIIVRGYRYALK